MRDAYHEELEEINDQLVEMTRLVESAMSRASRSLLDADLRLAESVIAADEHIDALYASLERRAFDLMARQQPVAGDLRFLITSLRIVAELERMADLAVHIATAARPELGGARGAALHDPRDGAGGGADRGEGGHRHRDHRRGARRGARARRRRDGRPAARVVRPHPRQRVDRERGGGRGRDAVRPLLRAVRRPRRVGGAAGRVPRDRRAPARADRRARVERHRTTRRVRRARRQRRPWLATAWIAASAAAGSRYSPPGLTGLRSASSS